MGNLNSFTLQDIMDMDLSDSYSEGDDDLFENLQDDVLGENYLILILRQLIHSREIQLIQHDEEHVCTMKLPTIRRRPNLDVLKKSSIYHSIKQASGFKADETHPESKWSVMKMLAERQAGVGPSKVGRFTQNEKCKINNIFVPNKYEKPLVKLDNKVFCGKFSRDGNYFVTASQDHKLRVFDATTKNYPMVNRVTGKDISWSMLDVDFSPCGEYFVYCTWSDCLHLSKIHGTAEDLQCLPLKPEPSRFCIFSVAFSNCGKELIGGANDGCLYIYDRVLDRKTLKVSVADNQVDVNSVGFADETTNIFFSGGEDSIIKLWDRRTLNEARPQPVGKLVGHFDGITYIDARNDGRHLISNSKDQSIKLWDLRLFSPNDSEKLIKEYIKSRSWDYRWDVVPKIFYNPCKPIEGDTSVMTYRGHRVQKSLIRAKFSPVATTGQRFIYTGCSTGRVVIYDVLTGKMVSAIEGHSDMVRDVAWHPKRPEIISCGWDCNVNINSYIVNRAEKSSSSGGTPDDNNDDRNRSMPVRRSKRIALQRRNQGSSSSAT